MYWLYKPGISLYFKSIRLAALFRNDARQWVYGRIGWKSKLHQFLHTIEDRSEQRIWIHVASLGEFEQGRTLIELIRTNHPEKILILSFFSPSGYEKCKEYNQVDYVCYFPSDQYSEISFFIHHLKPSLVLFVKYDFWFNTIKILIQHKIPFCFISAIFRDNHFLFHPLFHSLLHSLKSAKRIFLQNESSYKQLEKFGFDNIQITGDTRLDRVYSIAKESNPIPRMEYFCDQEPVFIAGSIWESDLEIISQSISNAIKHGWKIILVPHHVDEITIRVIETVFHGQTIRYTKLTQSESKPVLIMDQIGFLSRLYQTCVFAYVGGGFGKGIHNILEPASHKKAVCFGPNYHKFQEAKDFIHLGIGFVIRNTEDLDDVFVEIRNNASSFRKIIEDYFQKNLGASHKIYQYLEQELIGPKS